MHPLSILLLLLTSLTPLTLAAPTSPPTNFYLVTTTSNTPSKNSSHLANVSATSLFDPFDQERYLLRLIGPGYLSLPQFNLTQGQLHSLSEGPEAQGEYVYNSTRVKSGKELMFSPSEERTGNLGLRDGFLLTVGGLAKGWSICDGPEDEQVILWEGKKKSCVDTYIQAVKTPPY